MASVGAVRGCKPGILIPAMLMRFVEWAFRDRRTGRIVIAQWPNLWLWVFIAASCLGRMIVATMPAGIAAHLVATGAFLVWACDELLRGVNPWRRGLGAAVLIGTALQRVV